MSEEQNDKQWQQRDIGAFWKKEGGHWSGKIKLKNFDFSKFAPDEEIGVIMFSNIGKKRSEKGPDFSMYVYPDEYERLKPGNTTSKESVAEPEQTKKEEVPDLLA